MHCASGGIESGSESDCRGCCFPVGLKVKGKGKNEAEMKGSEGRPDRRGTGGRKGSGVVKRRGNMLTGWGRVGYPKWNARSCATHAKHRDTRAARSYYNRRMHFLF